MSVAPACHSDTQGTCQPGLRTRGPATANLVGENLTKGKVAAGERVLFMGLNQMCTPNIAMIAAACGFDGVYIDLEHRPTSL